MINEDVFVHGMEWIVQGIQVHVCIHKCVPVQKFCFRKKLPANIANGSLSSFSFRFRRLLFITAMPTFQLSLSLSLSRSHIGKLSFQYISMLRIIQRYLIRFILDFQCV